MGRASDPHEIESERRDQAARRAAGNILKQLGTKIEYLDRCVSDPPDGDTYVRSIKITVDAGWDGSILAVVHVVREGEKFVGFHAADTLMELLTGLSNRMSNGSMKWKEDKPYAERKPN